MCKSEIGSLLKQKEAHTLCRLQGPDLEILRFILELRWLDEGKPGGSSRWKQAHVSEFVKVSTRRRTQQSKPNVISQCPGPGCPPGVT